MKSFLISIFFIGLSVCAQDIKSYKWDEIPKFDDIPEDFKSAPAVVLKDSRWVHLRVHQYAYASFIMKHEAIKINKKEVISEYNKVRAVNGLTRKVKDFHARIIKPDGRIEVLGEDKMVETEVKKIKSIAFEGVEEGDIIEYYYILKEVPDATNVEIFQRDIPVMNVWMKFTNSGGIFFDYQYTPMLKHAPSTWSDIFTAKNIPAYQEEVSALNFPLAEKLIYQAYMSYNGNAWSNYMFDNFKTIYIKSKVHKKAFTQLSDFIKKNQLETTTLSVDQRLYKVDEYIKKNFILSYNEKELSSKQNGVDKFYFGGFELIKIYQETLKFMNIPFVVKAVVNRYYGEIDKDVKFDVLPTGFVFYIPSTQKYLMPAHHFYTYGNPPYTYQNAKSVGYDFSEYKKPKLVREDKIDVVADSKFTIDQTEINIVLKEDFENAKFTKKSTYTGYSAITQKNNLKELDESEKKEEDTENYIKEVSLNGIESKMTKYEVLNNNWIKYFENEPLTYYIEAETTQDFVENAGNLLIVNLGKTIGKQMNLYQEIKRTKPVELAYAKQYKHKIIFEIPEGYKVESYKDLVIDKKMIRNNEAICSFISQVKIENKQLVVEVEETYGDISFSVEEYMGYRDIINAAADFEKASVIIKRL